ncbi:MAG: ATP-binding protein [Solirubrobacteraceae bacterium]
MQNNNKLTVTIYSFSYKKGIPADESGNGGGYVFDCRGVLNPGRINEYKTKTGRDQEVISYLEKETEIHQFLNLIKELTSLSITNYLKRGFSNLQISFGCTGGQHRSVYSAEKLANFIKEKFDGVNINLIHIEQESKNWVNETY